VQFLLVLAVLAAAVAVISAPLRAGRGGEDSPQEDSVAALEAAKEDKYREIRELELDFRTGKLSREDYDALDGTLRAEAIEILRRLDRAQGSSGQSTS